MYHLVVTYQAPANEEEFERYYADVHTPLVRAIPDLLGFSTFRGESLEPGAEPAWYLQAHLVFADKATAGAAFGSDAGRAAASDVSTFATGGVTVVAGEEERIAVRPPLTLPASP